MLKKILIGVAVIIVMVVAYMAYVISTTRSHSPQDIVSFEGTAFNMTLVYCQPFKKDRLIFGEKEEGALVPYGVHWRTGANEATEVEFSSDVLFGGEAVKAGKYRLYTIPNADKWKVVLNSEIGAWGYYEPDYTKDVVRVEVPTKMESNSLEQLTITSQPQGEGTNIVIQWDKTSVSIPINAQ